MSFAIIGVVTLLFIVFAILSAKSWHWVNIVFLVLTYLAGIGAVIGAAQVLQLRSKEVNNLINSEKTLAEVTKKVDDALYGTSESDEFTADSLYGLAEQYSLRLTGLGRVWASGSVAAKDNNRVYTFSDSSPQGDDMTDMLLHAFAEDSENRPVAYIGSLRVVEIGDSIELEPVFIANQGLYDSQDNPWTLYEKMPIDRHDTFLRDAGIKESEIDEMDISAFREKLRTEYLPAESFGLDVENNPDHLRRHEEILDRYNFDGLQIGTIKNWIDTQPDRSTNQIVWEPEPDETFIEYKFDKKSSQPFQVDAAGNVSVDGLFTKLGQAILPSLHVGGDGTVSFKAGDTILVDLLSSEGYTRPDGTVVKGFKNRETVTQISQRYIRKLNDYPYLLRSATVQTANLIEDIDRVVKNNEIANKSLSDADEQIGVRDILIEQMTADRDRLSGDRDKISQLLSSRTLKEEELRQQIQQLEQSIESIHRSIKSSTGIRNSFPVGIGR